MYLRRSLTATLLLGAIGASGCASGVQRVYVAPTNETVVTGVTEGRGDDVFQMIWVANRSTVPVTVYSVTLRSCENVRQPCEPRPMNVRLAAGEQRTVLRVEPKSDLQGFSFRYTFAWRPADIPTR